MDVSEVVAVAVLPDGDVVLAVQGDEVRLLTLGADAGARVAAGGERVDRRQDDEVGRALEHGVAVGETEGILHLHPERAEAVPAPQV